ncbi:hypothetical protein QE418_000571 [Microbacterium testaceum]|uniref:hypothetical protein n=1 Tax=Microbacterium TaxID=33882 RepID=UPI002788F5D1|nr:MULTISPECIES: hypothetical protein [Microbacterium]MDQ1111123.1 hypothetical protein [Microbacterium testaceum]MDR6098339.1 hypothetical protein [Microbacterium sp. SORGH_AS_0454]
MTRNPFALAEKVGRIAGYSVVVILVSFCFVTLAFAAVREWGWGALWAIPGVPVALVLLTIIAGLLRVLLDTIHDRWRMAKWRWDDRHPER